VTAVAGPRPGDATEPPDGWDHFEGWQHLEKEMEIEVACFPDRKEAQNHLNYVIRIFLG
jgi:hypothetical protein